MTFTEKELMMMEDRPKYLSDDNKRVRRNIQQRIYYIKKKNTNKNNQKALNIFKKNMKLVNEDFHIIIKHAQKTNYLLKKSRFHYLGWNDIIEEYKHQHQ